MTVILLERIKYIINKNIDKNKTAVITCSCLKKKYREQLGIPYKEIQLVYLGVPENIVERVENRENHYMKKEMIKSQLDILEIPDSSENCIFI